MGISKLISASGNHHHFSYKRHPGNSQSAHYFWCSSIGIHKCCSLSLPLMHFISTECYDYCLVFHSSLKRYLFSSPPSCCNFKITLYLSFFFYSIYHKSVTFPKLSKNWNIKLMKNAYQYFKTVAIRAWKQILHVI